MHNQVTYQHYILKVRVVASFKLRFLIFSRRKARLTSRTGLRLPNLLLVLC